MIELDRARPPAVTADRRWVITTDARRALIEEMERLAGDLAAGGPAEASARTARRFETIRAVLETAVCGDEPGLAAIGRRVTVQEVASGEHLGTFALVIPGDGDPDRGWISVDSPLGAAVVGRRTGERTEVMAPGGAWTARITVVGAGPILYP